MKALFVDGPRGGDFEEVSGTPHAIYVYRGQGFSYWVFGSRHADLTIQPEILEYRRVCVSPDGHYGIFELHEPKVTKHVFGVEVEVIPGADPLLSERVLSELLHHIDGHQDAFTGGILSAHVVKD